MDPGGGPLLHIHITSPALMAVESGPAKILKCFTANFCEGLLRVMGGYCYIILLAMAPF